MWTHLDRLAEEIGRLAARRELEAERNHRRGYSIAELVFGAVITAVFWVLATRVLAALLG